MSATLGEVVRGHRLVVCVGPGGVGKTTVSAGLAIAAARAGKRVLVLTIDPARRLADALGLDGLDDAPRAVPERAWASEYTGLGSLEAAMLETRASFDALIARVVPSETARAAIMGNAVYRAFSRTLARSHAYVASERLYDALSSDRYDTVVLDTPPLRSALEILDAPGRLVRFLDDGVLRWFVDTNLGGPRGIAGAMAARVFTLLAGEEMADQVLGFFRLFLSLRSGFASRADVVQAAMRDAGTAFLLVSAPDAACMDDAAFLHAGLRERGITPSGVVINRAFVAVPGTRAPFDDAHTQHAIADARTQLPSAHAVWDALASVTEQTARENRDAHARIEQFCARERVSCPRYALPAMERDAFTLDDLVHALLDARGGV